MQIVSKAYKKHIRDQLRDRGYMMISFGVINQKAQAKARVGTHDNYYPLTREGELYKIFSQTSEDLLPTYTALEEDFSPVDGSYLFPPRKNERANYTGIISENTIANGVFRLEINLGKTPFSFKGFTIDFGESYPKRIRLTTDAGKTIDGTLTSGLYKTEEVFTEVRTITITVLEMVKTQTRARIRSVLIGYGLLYTNTNIIDSSLDSYSSPIGAECPQIDFFVTLNNRNRYFDVDNPNSAINFLEIGQELKVLYGYQVGDDIEWINGATLACSGWESDEHITRLKATDRFRKLDMIYEESDNGRPRQLTTTKIEKVLDSAGLISDDVGLDPWFKIKTPYITNPIPRVKVREALQLIANASRAILSIDRDGKLSLKTRFKPTISVHEQNIAKWGNVQNIYGRKKATREYAILYDDAVTVDGRQKFYPRNEADLIKSETGFATVITSPNSFIGLELDVERKYYGLYIEFGDALPSSIDILAVSSDKSRETITITNIKKIMTIPLEFKAFMVLLIRFNGEYATVNNIKLGDETDFTIGKWDMLSSPKAIKQELVKEIVVECYQYNLTNPIFTPLLSSEQEVTAGTTTTVTTSDYSVGVNIPAENTEWVELVTDSPFAKTLRFKKSGKVKLNLTTSRIPLTILTVTKTLNREGKTITVRNPLIGTIEEATNLAEWLADYYKVKITYEYNTRGFPELDVNDYIFQENDYAEDMQSEVTHTTLTFNGAWKGKIKARRREIGEDD